MRQRLLISIIFIVGCNAAPDPAKESSVEDAEQRLVRAVIAEQLNVDPKSIPMDCLIQEPPLKMDDLDFVHVVMTLEERRGVEISDAALERYRKLGDTVRITPNQLATVVRDARNAAQPKRRK